MVRTLTLLLIAPLLSGCIAVAAVGAAGAVTGAAIGATGAVIGATVGATGAAIDAVTPGDDDDEKHDD